MFYLVEFNKDNLFFKKQMNEDAETMSYNAGYDLDVSGYNKNDGTIYKSDSEYLAWLEKWQNKNDRFVAAVVRKSDNKMIGEVCFHPDDTPSGYDLGIVLLASERGKGYSKKIMQLLLNEIKARNIKKVNHTIPSSRTSAIKCDLACGFVKVGTTTSIKFGEIEKVTILEKKF